MKLFWVPEKNTWKAFWLVLLVNIFLKTIDGYIGFANTSNPALFAGIYTTFVGIIDILTLAFLGVGIYNSYKGKNSKP